MIGLDTNVLVRYIMQDDARQSALATRLVESLSVESPGFVPLVSVVELAWVLSSAYALDRVSSLRLSRACCARRRSWSSGRKSFWKALRVFQSANADFADCLIERSAAVAGCDRTMTFDRGAAKSCGMTLVT